MRVLVVDDSSDQFILIKEFLSVADGMQFELDWASTYQAGQKAILQDAHDIYIFDYHLGDQNGLELMREAIASGCKAPMILLTGRGDRGIDIEAMQVGAADYLEKSEITPQSLERSIRYATERARAAESVRKSEERLRAIITNAPISVFSLNREGIITSLEGKQPDRSEFLAKGDIGASIFDVFGRTSDFEAVRHLQSALKGTSGSFVANFGDSAFEVRYSPLYSPKGDVGGVIGVAADVSARKRAEAAEAEQRTLAEALRDTAEVLNSTLDFEKVLDRILGIVERVAPHDTANIMLIESGVASIVRAKGYQNESTSIPELRFVVRDIANLQQIVDTGQPVIIPDTTTYPGWLDLPISRAIRSWVGVPIMVGDEVIGFLNLDSATSNFFTPNLVGGLQAFSHQVAIAVNNAHLYKQAQELAALEERQRLARDLHDAVSQTLFSASMIAESLPRLWVDIPPRAQERLLELHRLTRRALLEMRSLLLELRPKALIETSLDELLHQLAETFTNRSRAEVTLDADADISLVPDVQIACYRFAQEALNNIMKHARASRVIIRLRRVAGGAELQILDNGIGFDAANIPPGHFGLKFMYERADKIGAKLYVHSEIQKGTDIRWVWPGAKM